VFSGEPTPVNMAQQQNVDLPPPPEQPPTVADITKLYSRVASQPMGKKRRPKTFHKFALLPPEIRVMIWGLLYIARVHHVSYEKEVSRTVFNDGMPRPWEYGTWRYLSPRPPLPTRSVCQESRRVFLKAHTLLQLDHDSEWRVFFNFRTDTVFYDTNTCPDCVRVSPPVHKQSPYDHRVLNIAVSLQLIFGWKAHFDDPDCDTCNRKCVRRVLCHPVIVPDSPGRSPVPHSGKSFADRQLIFLRFGDSKGAFFRSLRVTCVA